MSVDREQLRVLAKQFSAISSNVVLSLLAELEAAERASAERVAAYGAQRKFLRAVEAERDRLRTALADVTNLAADLLTTQGQRAKYVANEREYWERVEAARRELGGVSQ